MEEIEITEGKPYTVPEGKVLYIGDKKINEGYVLEFICSPAEGIGLVITGVQMDIDPQITIGEQK